MPEEVLELSDAQILWAIQNIDADKEEQNNLIKDLFKSFIYVLYPDSTIENKKEGNIKEQEDFFLNELIKDGATEKDIEEIKNKR